MSRRANTARQRNSEPGTLCVAKTMKGLFAFGRVCGERRTRRKRVKLPRSSSMFRARMRVLFSNPGAAGGFWVGKRAAVVWPRARRGKARPNGGAEAGVGGSPHNPPRRFFAERAALALDGHSQSLHREHPAATAEAD